jgi:adenylate cyclase
MAQEIERKFLVKDDTWRECVTKASFYRQGYLANSSGASVRVRVADEKGYLNIKSMTLGVSRHEFEYEIPLSDAEDMLDNLCVGPKIEKTRYFVKYGNHIWEVDVFEGDNEGLVVAEIELASEDEQFKLPRWAGKEVSHEERYYNVCLVQHPYKEWKDKT